LGGTQSLHTNSFDEAMALPTPASAAIARATQLVIQEESGIPRVVDPLGGSYYVEALTASLVQAAQELIDEVEKLGGMTKAVESGLPKLRIEEAAARRQARVDRGEEVIVGVNKYRTGDAAEIDILDVDNAKVRDSQIARLNRVKATRDAGQVQAALNALAKAAAESSGNLLELSIAAMRARATLGEVSSALEQVFGRHKAEIRSVAGVYGAAYRDDPDFQMIQRKVQDFAREEGRRPRLLVVKLGQDGHDRGAKIIATAFADIGFDVDVGPLFQTPEEAARQAVENDVHVIGVSSQAAGHKTLVPQLIAALKQADSGDILVVAGGVIPAQDYPALTEAGVAAIFGPGTNIPKAAAEILRLIHRRRKAAQ
jgi:methylmalonyl-CoA mutase